jgi:hypothetical protein
VTCKGSGILELLTDSGGASTVLARFKFNIRAHAPTSVKLTLSHSAQARFTHKSTIVGLVVTLKGPSVHGTYSATMTVTRHKAPTQH